MDVNRLRFLDRWIGVPLCASLTLLRRVIELCCQQKDTPIKHILFVKLAEQGATVLAESAIEAAAKVVGHNNIYFLVFAENRPILDAMALIPSENIITIQHKNMKQLAVSATAALASIWENKIDAVVDLDFFSRGTAVISFLTLAAKRVGYHSYTGEGPYRGDLFTHRVIYNPHLHASQSFLSLVQILALSPDTLPATPVAPAQSISVEPKKFEPSAEEVVFLKGLFKKKDRSLSSPLLLLNANCSDLLPLRRWPDERYVALANELLATYPEISIAFTGTKGEAPAVAALLKQINNPRCFSLAGETTMHQLLTLYTMAEVMVTNDSGPAHFAALSNMDVITLFGPETPALFGSLSKRSHVLWAGLACSPCVSALNNRTSRCRTNLCMQLISVEQVFKEVCRVYELRREEGRLVCEQKALHAGPGYNDSMEDILRN